MKYFITSDVHGHYSILKKCLEDKGWEDDNPDHMLILCGDAFDRGDEAVELFDFLKSLGDRLIYIKGNHEYLALNLYRDIPIYGITDISGAHYHNKTLHTLDQFSPGLLEAFFGYPLLDHWKTEKLKSFIKFLKTKPINYFELGDNIFCHGWIPKDYKNATKEDWYRASWLNGMREWSAGNLLEDKTIYCGHWYTTWGHTRLHSDIRSKDIPFIDEGIVALDSTVVTSGFLNIIVLEI